MRQILTTLCLLFSLQCLVGQERPPYAIVIHGGAGNVGPQFISPQTASDLSAKLSEALDKGICILDSGGTSLDAVEAVICILEDSPLFNAGKGAVFTHEGRNELDASIMDGKTLNAGAVAGIGDIKNPVSAARIVMEKSSHVLLMGAGGTGGVICIDRNGNIAMEFNTSGMLRAYATANGEKCVRVF